MSFTLDKFTEATLRSLNVRAEMHGADPIPAADLSFDVHGHNNMLLMFDAGLKAAFYKKEGASNEPEFEEVDPTSDMPELRSPSVQMPIALRAEYLGRILVIDYGLGGKSNIELVDCKINAFRVDCQEKGRVVIRFRAQVSGVSEKILGKLASLVRHDVKITIASSSMADGTQEVLVPKKGAVDPGPPPDAGDIFSATHGSAAVQAARAVLKAKLGPTKTLKAKMKVAAKKVAAKKPAAKKSKGAA